MKLFNQNYFHDYKKILQKTNEIYKKEEELAFDHFVCDKINRTDR